MVARFLNPTTLNRSPSLILLLTYSQYMLTFAQFVHPLDLYGGGSVLNILSIIKLGLFLLQKLKTSGPEMIQLFLYYLVFGYVVSEHPKL